MNFKKFRDSLHANFDLVFFIQLYNGWFAFLKRTSSIELCGNVKKKSKYSFWLQKEVKNQILHIFQTSDIIYIVILVFFFKFESVLKDRTSKNIFL